MSFTSVSVLFLAAVLAQAQSSNQCGYKATGFEGIIRSPENQYQSVSCVWNITAPPAHRIRLRSTSFNLPGSPNSCHYSWLMIRGIVTEKKNINYRKFCGTIQLPEITPLGSNIDIEYYFSGSSGPSFFSLVYTAVPADVREETQKWISSNEEVLLAHKESLPRSLPALRLFNDTYFHKDNMTGYKFKTQYLLKLSADLLRNSTRPLSAAVLSHHVFALLAICSNPRSFHGIDLVHRLRDVVDKDPSLAKPFELLVLCSAGENLTSKDMEILNKILNVERRDIYMLDFQAVGIMALICAKEQNRDLLVNQNLQKAVDDITGYQRKDGSFGSLRTTVLVAQALSAAAAQERCWNKTSSLRFIESRNNTDGSFGNIGDMYTALPVLSGKSILDINARKCDFSPDGITPLEEVEDKMTELISVTYYLWIGDERDVKHTIELKFPNGTKFFDVMRLAAEKDEKFQMKWTFVKDDLYIYQIAGHINDPTGGMYWNLYTFNHSTELVPFKDRLETYIPEDGDTAIMWYRAVNLQQ